MINQEYILSKASDLAKQIHGHDASGHDFHHILRVVHMAEHLAHAEKTEAVDLFLVRLASYLHDIDDPKLSDGKEHRLLMFLAKYEVPVYYQERLVDIIDNLSYSSSLKGKVEQTIEGKIVQDADRLDALGAIGIARTFSYGGAKGRLIDDEDKNATMHHFEAKLLKLKDLMNTKEAKRIAKKRHKFILSFLSEYDKETKRLD